MKKFILLIFSVMLLMITGCKKEKLTTNDIAVCNASKNGNVSAVAGLGSKANNSEIKDATSEISTSNTSNAKLAVYKVRQICLSYGY